MNTIKLTCSIHRLSSPKIQHQVVYDIYIWCLQNQEISQPTALWKSLHPSWGGGQSYLSSVGETYRHSPFDRQIVGSRTTALETLLVLRQVITKAKFSNLEHLVSIIREAGRRLVDAQPKGGHPSCSIRFVSYFYHHHQSIPLAIRLEKFSITYERSITQQLMPQAPPSQHRSQYPSSCYRANLECRQLPTKSRRKAKARWKKAIPMILTRLREGWSLFWWRRSRMSLTNWKPYTITSQKMLKTTSIQSKCFFLGSCISIISIFRFT